MVTLQEPYARRPVRFLDVWDLDGWRMKAYGIAYAGERPRPDLVDAARAVAEATLPQPAMGDGRYGVGFVGIHDGRGHCFVFVDWWADENELHHHVFISPAESPAALEEATASGLAACVWDLAVIGFERDAWVAAVLDRDGPPDLDEYLGARMDGWV